MRGLCNYRGIKGKLFKGAAIAAMAFAIGMCGNIDSVEAASGSISGVTATSSASALKNAANKSKNSDNKTIAGIPVAATADDMSDMAALKKTMVSTIGKENYGVYLEFPNTKMPGNPIYINDKKMRSASMIKVFIMSYAFDQIKKGQLSSEETIELQASDKVGGAGSIAGLPNGTKLTINDLITKMITQSDNTATNMLIDKFGILNINQYIQTNGYSNTVLRRKMMDTDAVKKGIDNMTSPSDLGHWFAKVYRHECIGEPYDSAMITILLLQEDVDGIPAALHDKDQVAHKTGELDKLCDDGGIIYSPSGDFVLIVMDDGVSRNDAIAKIHSLTTLAKAYTVLPDTTASSQAPVVPAKGNAAASSGPVVKTAAPAANASQAKPVAAKENAAAATPAKAATTASTMNTATTAASTTNAAVSAISTIAWNTGWQYADKSAIHTDSSKLYKSNAAARKNITVALNAGHGTLNGTKEQTFCHPDGSPKVTGGSTAEGAIKTASIVAGTVLSDGTPEAKANLAAAMVIKDALLNAGYDVLMLRENDDTRLDNVARTVLANNNANCHISIHYDSTDTDKGFFCINVPQNAAYKAMEPVKSHWQEHDRLAVDIVQGARDAGIKIFSKGLIGIDLTQTSYSTVPSVDVEVGDKASKHGAAEIKAIAQAIVKGLGYYFGK